MRKRSLILFAVLAVAGIGLADFVWYSFRKPEGSFYGGLATNEWERELVKWEVSRPPCGLGGYTRWVTRRPCALNQLREKIGIPLNEEPSNLLLLNGDPNALPVLMELLKTHHPNTRRIAIEGIRRIGDPAIPAMPLLVEALEDTDSDMSCEAAATLMRWDKVTVYRWLGIEK